MAEIIRQGRLDGRQRNRLKSLLNMKYKPSELGEEIGFSANQVYMVYVPFGCPHVRDEKNRIWINGKLFREWYIENYQKPKVGKDQAFCLTCKKPVNMHNPELKKKEGLTYWVCECPECGRKLSRIVSQVRTWKKK